jgi:site-specific recombinase XerC
VYVVAELNAWLAERGLSAEDLAGPTAGRFWEDLRAQGNYLVKGASLEPLLGYLRDLGVLPRQAGGRRDAAGVLMLEYGRYLRLERRAGEVTIAHYLGYANEFLSVAGGLLDGPEFDARLAALDSAQVLDIVSRQVARHRLPSVGAALTGDRAFLRFLEHTGRTARSLVAAVPRAARQPSRLPGQVDPATAAAILASCDRGTEGGCRDRAVLLLLHRYGLRPVEVARLELLDLHWRAGEFVVHGKGGRVDVLPLLRDAGEAIVEYLQIRQPAPPGVAAVFLSARAPVQPMRKNSIGALVGRACARAGVARIGPRAFRHAVGHDMLNSGASLVEIRDVLRHRDIETTSAYTRADIATLRPLARPWPGAGRQRAAETAP